MERTLEDVARLRRIELAILHADEMSAALAVLDADDMAALVRSLRKKHAEELSAWSATNG